MLNTASGQLRQIRVASERQFEAIQANDLPAILATENTLRTSRETWSRSLDDITNVLNEAISIGQRRVAEVYEQSRTSIILALAVVAIISVLITYMLRSSIANPLNAFMEFVERVGRGDLGRPDRHDGHGRVRAGSAARSTSWSTGFDNWRSKAARRPRT